MLALGRLGATAHGTGSATVQQKAEDLMNELGHIYHEVHNVDPSSDDDASAELFDDLPRVRRDIDQLLQ
jgi:hypothetical protein